MGLFRDRLLAPFRRPKLSEDRQLISQVVMSAGKEPGDVWRNFKAYADEGYRTSAPIFSLIAVRVDAFSEARFQWRNRRTREMFGTEGLALLETPWPNATTGDLLALMELDVSLAGNAFWYNRGDDLARLRPDWVDVMSEQGPLGTSRLVGYAYHPGGRQAGKEPVMFLPDEIAHYWDRPHPYSQFVGESWLSAAARDGDADTSMQQHKRRFFVNAATPNLAIKAQTNMSEDQKKYLTEWFQARYAGAENAYRTLVLEGGADIMPLGHSFEQMTFSTVQAAGETRLAAAAGVPPVVVGFLQGIQSATYSNYAQAMRRFADLTIRPKWRRVAGALQSILEPPGGSELWYDDRDIPFLQQDEKDAAEIRKSNALTLEALVRTGFTAESAIQAVTTGKFDNLVHTGLVSVQLQPPGQDLGSNGGSGTDNPTE